MDFSQPFCGMRDATIIHGIINPIRIDRRYSQFYTYNKGLPTPYLIGINAHICKHRQVLNTDLEITVKSLSHFASTPQQ